MAFPGYGWAGASTGSWVPLWRRFAQALLLVPFSIAACASPQPPLASPPSHARLPLAIGGRGSTAASLPNPSSTVRATLPVPLPVPATPKPPSAGPPGAVALFNGETSSLVGERVIGSVSLDGTTPVITVTEQPAVAAGEGNITITRIDLNHARLILHAGFVDPLANGGWKFGSTITRAESPRLLAAFTAGFKQRDSRGGWRSEGRTVRPLVRGAASVVIYSDGGVDIGAWGSTVPQSGRTVTSVRQNLTMLISHGRALDNPSESITAEMQQWGVVFRGTVLAARSSLGVTSDHKLVFVAGNDITVHALSSAMIHAGVVRGLQLDINAPLVRGFLFPRVAPIMTDAGRSLSSTIPLVIGQTQPPGTASLFEAPHCTYTLPCARDFFTVVSSPPNVRDGAHAAQ